jgi:membrane protease YdiL (CAAX protease family)
MNRRAINLSVVPARFPWEYFLVTFGFSWLCWLPDVLDTSGVIKLLLPRELFLVLGVMGPLVSAVWVTFKKGGWKAVRSFFARSIDARFEVIWWLIIMIVPFMVTTLAYIILCRFHNQTIDLSPWRTPWMIIPSILFMFFIGGGQEEFGWRGVALDALQGRWTALIASLVLGLIHGIWHLPLFFILGTGQYFMPIWLFLLTTPAISILATWIYNSTGKKLFAAWLLHATLNAANGVFPLFPNEADQDQSGFLILCGLIWIWALIVLAVYGSHKLARSNTTRAQASP